MNRKQPKFAAFGFALMALGTVGTLVGHFHIPSSTGSALIGIVIGAGIALAFSH